MLVAGQGRQRRVVEPGHLPCPLVHPALFMVFAHLKQKHTRTSETRTFKLLVGIIGDWKIKMKNRGLLLMSRTFCRLFFNFLSRSLCNSIVYH